MKNRDLSRLGKQLLAALCMILTGALISHTRTKRWSEKAAQDWYTKRPWLVGSNYIPATAINQLEMWQADTFDPKRIDLELGLAESLGMNTMRVFLHDLLWQQDSEGFKKRIGMFLTAAEKHHIQPIFVLFDSCWDPNPHLGKQPPPRPGVMLSAWAQSPGAAALKDPSQYPRLEKYVKGVVGAFASDNRVLGWDLWNEPDNMNGDSYGNLEPPNKPQLVEALLPKVFAWAREAAPIQPLTSSVWAGGWSGWESLTPISKIQVTESDVISFHTYDSPTEVEQRIASLLPYRRPILCTEYMARSRNSTFQNTMPILKQHHVAAINWGFVNGKTQTMYPWDSWEEPYDHEPTPWFHDIFRKDGQPYEPTEVEFIRGIINKGDAFEMRQRWSEEVAQEWYAKQPWLVGSNYIPATAINQLEMWQADTFDPKRIDLELVWAESLGMNTMRVFLHDLLWQQDSIGFRKRVDVFLSIAEKHHIRPIFVLFDSAWDPNPHLGKQPPPRPGVMLSAWLQSPGADTLEHQTQYPKLEAYVKGIVGAFRKDRRVLVWDVWNEPTIEGSSSCAQGCELEAPNKAQLVLALLPKVFQWAREAEPTQPLTSGVWAGGWSTWDKWPRMAQIQIEESDILSFHTYDSPEEVLRRIESLRAYHRPILCTEYMARSRGSTFQNTLPILKKYNIAAYNWGLVTGKTQAIYPWSSWQKPYDHEPTPWFHDVFRTDGQPYDPEEVKFVRETIGLHPVMLLP